MSFSGILKGAGNILAGKADREDWKNVAIGAVGAVTGVGLAGSAVGAAAGASVVGGVRDSYVQGVEAEKAAKEAVASAKKLADEQEQAFNKANMKKPNYLGIKSNNSIVDTTLLGGGGSTAPLGKTTLLGR